MTKIERQIGELLTNGPSSKRLCLESIAALYARGRSSSFRVYSRIDWDRLDDRIRQIHGEKGLSFIKRHS